MTTYDRLRQWLEAEQVTQAELARRCEYDKGNMHRILNGKLRPTLDLAFRIERATDGAISASEWTRAA